jgi:YihY family inner membrane protein
METPTETVPLESYARTVEASSLTSRVVPTIRYLFSIEAHVYAFSIAANVLLSSIPFAVLLLTFCDGVLHSQAAVDAILVLIRDSLPSNHDFIMRNLRLLARSRKNQLASLGMLLFTASGVMLPLEVALNKVWGVQKNRSFLWNQLVAYLLAFVCGLAALASVLVTAANQRAIAASLGRLGWERLAQAATYLTLKLTTLPAIIGVLFLLFYVLPNGKVPVRPVLMAAIFCGVACEVAKHVFIWVLPLLNFREVYGPFFVSVTLLMWAFVSAMVMLAGAHLSARPLAGPRSKVQGPRSDPASP